MRVVAETKMDAEKTFWHYQKVRQRFPKWQVDILGYNVISVTKINDTELSGFLHDRSKNCGYELDRVLFTNNICRPYTLVKFAADDNDFKPTIIATACDGRLSLNVVVDGNRSSMLLHLKDPASLVRYDFQRHALHVYSEESHSHLQSDRT